MKKKSDSKLYFYAGIVTLAVAIILAIPSYYSICIVEPKVEKLLNDIEHVDRSFKEAYIILRNPQIFAGYDHFDTKGISVKNSITFFDRFIYSKQELTYQHKRYIEILLARRMKGSRLGRFSSIFFLCMTMVIGIAFFFEKNSLKRKKKV